MPPALSCISVSDAQDFATAAKRSKRLHAGWVHPPTTAESAAALAKRRAGPSDFGYLVRDSASSQLAGFIDVTGIVRGNFQSAYLGYYVFLGYERQGFMKWALGETIKRAWRELKLHRLEANVQPGNYASIALVKALGFEREGYSSAYLKIGGRWRDHERWAIRAR